MTLIEKLIGDLNNTLHEYPQEGKNGKYRPFVSNSPTMANLNTSGVDLGADRPAETLPRTRNSHIIVHLAGLLTLSVTTNSRGLPEVMPASHFKKPNSELLMRHNQLGTEVRFLQDPHLPHVHYLAMKRVWGHNHRQILRWLSEAVHPKLKGMV